MPNFKREDLDRIFFNREWEPVFSSAPEFINYRKIITYGQGHAGIISVCLSPEVYTQYSRADEAYAGAMQALIYGH